VTIEADLAHHRSAKAAHEEVGQHERTRLNR
jgi:hypothetical protein